MLVAVAVLVLAAGAWWLVQATSAGLDDSSAGSPPSAANAGAQPPDQAGPRGPSEASSVSPLPASDVDQSLPVVVRNGTGRNGLATRTARLLHERGWSAAVGGDERALATTTVFYPRAEQRPTAQAVAADLGLAAGFERSTRYGSDAVTVVLGADAG